MSLWPRGLWPRRVRCGRCGDKLGKGGTVYRDTIFTGDGRGPPICWTCYRKLSEKELDGGTQPVQQPSMMSSASSWVANPTQSSSSRPSIVDADGRTWEIVDGDGRPIPASTKCRTFELEDKERPLRKLDK